MNKKPTKKLAKKRLQATDLAAESNAFLGHLEQMGLPSDGIIATTPERNVVSENLYNFLEALDPATKSEARYLSKFVGASAIGLFDAALNYLWNEVVLNLRSKAMVYGLDLFYDAAVGDKIRDTYKDEADLVGIKDGVLLDTCRKLEIVSDIVYKKLDYIRIMRNDLAASHPNVGRIGGYELMGWLQTCVTEVLEDQPSESAIRIKTLVANLKKHTAPISSETASRINGDIGSLSTIHVDNLLTTFFGIYVSPSTDQVLRKNISMISKTLWRLSNDKPKLKIGSQANSFMINLDTEKQLLGFEFLDHVDGREFVPESAKAAALRDLAEKLLQVHSEWDNFHHEPVVMEEILKYCKKSTDIPKRVRPLLVDAVTTCRIGNGVQYRDGVSPAGKPLYDAFFEILDDDGIVDFIVSIRKFNIISKLETTRCQNHFLAILNILEGIVVDGRLDEAISLLKQKYKEAPRALSSKDFKKIMLPYER